MRPWRRPAPHLMADEGVIELTDAITVLTDGFVPDELYDRVKKHFEEVELAYLIAAITVINAGTASA